MSFITDRVYPQDFQNESSVPKSDSQSEKSWIPLLGKKVYFLYSQLNNHCIL